MASTEERAQWTERDRVLSEIDEPDLSTSLRPDIIDSWRRSALTGITPGTDSVPYTQDLPADSRLLRAAEPVVTRLADQLGGSPATILLGDSAAHIISRRAGSHDILSRLDSAQVAPGFQYSEDTSGTNGIGTALEERRLFSVRGAEHYREALQSLACVGRPIVHPIGRNVEGILDITCAVADANDLMAPLVNSAVREIEQRLYDMASRDEQALLEEFLRTSRRGHSAVVTLASDVVMTNPRAAQLLAAADQSVLWSWAWEHLGNNQEYAGELELSDRTGVRARARRLTNDEHTIGVTLELQVIDPARPDGLRGVPAGASPPVRRSVTSRVDRSRRASYSAQIEQELAIVVSDPGPTLVSGEPGVGKRHAARYLHSQWASGEVLTEYDVRRLAEEDQSAWLADVESGLRAGRTMVVRNLEALSDDSIANFVAVVEQANEEGWLLVVTGATTPDRRIARVWAHLRRRVEIPPLSQRPGEIEQIVTAVLERRGGGLQRQHLQPAAMQSLRQRDWPENVRELEAVVEAAAARALGGDIGLQHLPAGYRDVRAGRAVPAMERAEVEAILSALKESRGNKAETARLLGVARSTLYRKLREYGIDSDRFLQP